MIVSTVIAIVIAASQLWAVIAVLLHTVTASRPSTAVAVAGGCCAATALAAVATVTATAIVATNAALQLGVVVATV